MALSDVELRDLGRLQYQSSGQVDWTRLLPWIPAGFLGAAAIAVGLALMDVLGCYFVVVIPAIAGIGTYHLASRVIEYGHCRSQFVAFLVTLPIGLIAYLGYYQVQFAHETGWEMASRIDLLPKIIWTDWKTRVLVGREGFKGGPDDLTFTCNVVVFIAELMIIGIFAHLGGVNTTNRVYAESRQSWTKSVTRIVSEKWGLQIEQSIRSNDLANLMPSIQVMPIPDPKHPPPRTIMTLEYTDDGEMPNGYLSVTHVSNRGSVIVKQLQLTAEEFHACGPLFL